MKKALGWVAAALLVGAPAFANNAEEAQQRSRSEKSKQQSETMATGGAGEQGAAMQAHELSGEVLRVEGNMVYLQHMGAVVPVQLQRSTRFEGVQGKDELKQGQQVRAQFTISSNQKMNLAQKVTVGEEQETGTGGAGFENEGYSEDPSGVMPDQNGTVIKNEGKGSTDIHNTPAGGRPESAPGVGGAGEAGQEDEGADQEGGVFQTGDVSGKTRGTTVPEGEEPGTGSPLPRGETY